MPLVSTQLHPTPSGSTFAHPRFLPRCAKLNWLKETARQVHPLWIILTESNSSEEALFGDRYGLKTLLCMSWIEAPPIKSIGEHFDVPKFTLKSQAKTPSSPLYSVASHTQLTSQEASLCLAALVSPFTTTWRSPRSTTVVCFCLEREAIIASSNCRFPESSDHPGEFVVGSSPFCHVPVVLCALDPPGRAALARPMAPHHGAEPAPPPADGYPMRHSSPDQRSWLKDFIKSGPPI
jgi:hypothetical protein